MLLCVPISSKKKALLQGSILSFFLFLLLFGVEVVSAFWKCPRFFFHKLPWKSTIFKYNCFSWHLKWPGYLFCYLSKTGGKDFFPCRQFKSSFVQSLMKLHDALTKPEMKFQWIFHNALIKLWWNSREAKMMKFPWRSNEGHMKIQGSFK